MLTWLKQACYAASWRAWGARDRRRVEHIDELRAALDHAQRRIDALIAELVKERKGRDLEREQLKAKIARMGGER